MLECVLGSQSAEKVLVFLCCRDEGYASGIAKFFDTGVTPIKKQLEKLEVGGVLVSRSVGKTLVFRFNPRNPFIDEIKALMTKVVTYYPQGLQDRLLKNRRRPRRRGKPL
ncbi:MAG: hypothetical protein V3V74_07020 [Nitrosomonadaceae bacterium]